MLFLCVYQAHAEKLRPEHDLTYIGAVRVPTDSSSDFSWSYTSDAGKIGALVYNPVSGTLISPSMIINENANFAKVTQFTIPTPVISTSHTISALPRATTVNDWTDMTQGKWDVDQNNAVLSGMAYLPAQGTQTSPKLYWLTTSWYG